MSDVPTTVILACQNEFYNLRDAHTGAWERTRDAVNELDSALSREGQRLEEFQEMTQFLQRENGTAAHWGAEARIDMGIRFDKLQRAQELVTQLRDLLCTTDLLDDD